MHRHQLLRWHRHDLVACTHLNYTALVDSMQKILATCNMCKFKIRILTNLKTHVIIALWHELEIWWLAFTWSAESESQHIYSTTGQNSCSLQGWNHRLSRFWKDMSWGTRLKLCWIQPNWNQICWLHSLFLYITLIFTSLKCDCRFLSARCDVSLSGLFIIYQYTCPLLTGSIPSEKLMIILW